MISAWTSLISELETRWQLSRTSRVKNARWWKRDRVTSTLGKQAILLNLFSMKEEKQHLSICRITGFGFMNYFSFEGSFRRTSGAIHWGCTEKNGGVQHLQTNASELTTLRTIIMEQIADKKMIFKKEKKKANSNQFLKHKLIF
jgi:hypothetical protein